MSNPFLLLDLSDDENITIVKPVAETKPEKKHVVHPRHADVKPHQPRKELQKQEEDLKQKKKGPPGPRGFVPQPDVAHPGERSLIGLKKEEHVNTHKLAEQEPRRGRMFDRHSGTGRGREIKKGGGGGHNWGKAGEELVLPPKTPEPTDAANAAAISGPESSEGKEDAAAVPVVEEEPAKTLEDYEKERALKRSGAGFEAKEARKVTTEVVGKAYKKDENLGEGDYIKLSAENDGKSKKPGHVKVKAKQVLEIDFKVRDTTQEAPRGGGGDRPRGNAAAGGRSEGRPFRQEGGAPPPRGGGNVNRPRGAVGGRTGPSGAGGGRLDTADQSAFPKLGGA